MANKPGEMGIAEVASRAQVPAMNRRGVAVQPDPVNDAMQARKTVLATQLLDQTSAELEANRLEQENKLIEQQIRQQELREAAAARAGEKSDTQAEWMRFVMERMERTEQQLVQAQEALSAQQAAMLEQRLSMLQQELTRLQTQPVTPATPAPTLKQQVTDLRDTLEGLRDLNESLMPVPAPVPAAAPQAFPQQRQVSDADVRIYEIRQEMEFKRWQQTQADRHAENMAKIEADKAVAERKIQLEATQAAQRDRLVNQTLPKLTETLQTIAGKFIDSRAPAAPVAQGYAAAAAQPEARAMAIPDGALTDNCPNCGAALWYMPHWPGVGCTNCGNWADNTNVQEPQTAAGAEPIVANSSTQPAAPVLPFVAPVAQPVGIRQQQAYDGGGL